MSEPFFSGTSTYNEKEAVRASKIKAMPDEEEKNYEIKHFEIETGKEFPHRRLLYVGYNMCTGH